MATKTVNAPKVENEDLRELGNLEYTKHCMTVYGMQTIVNRVIPDYRDGLIPVQRRILWSMHQLDNGTLRKSARIVGDVIGKFHPHGDVSCYDAIATIVQSPADLIEGAGNWGSFDNPEGVAAQRYTECRLTKLARMIYFEEYMVRSNDLIANYDASDKEPVVLNCNLPMALVLGKLGGIAVGVTCNIPSFTLASVIKLTLMALKGKTITPKICRNTLEFQFAWGGVLVDKHLSDGSLDSVMKDGTGSLSFRPDYRVDEKNGTLTLESMPPNANFESCILKTRNAGYKVSDLSSMETGMEVVVDLRKTRGTKHTKDDIRSVVGYWTGRTLPIRVAITDRQLTEEAIGEGSHALATTFEPNVGIADFITRWAAYRLDLEKKLASIEAGDLTKEKSNLNLIILARKNFEVVKAALDQSDPIAYLAKKLKIEIADAKYIMGRTLMQLSKADIAKFKNRISDINEALSVCKDRIKNPTGYVVKTVTAIGDFVK